MTCLQGTSHRPYPVVNRPWIMHMRWHDLAFLHWAVDPAMLRPLVPGELEIDTYDGRAWLGVIPFWMTNIRLRGLPPAPMVGSFEEINLRTYVTDGERAGVWFLSLDAHSRLGAAIARRWYRLNYHYARSSARPEGDWLRFESRRADGNADFIARYRPVDRTFHAPRATLEHWLCERYCLYAGGFGRPIYRGEIHHEPWPLQRCEVEIERNTLAQATGLPPMESRPHALFAKRLDVVVWSPRRIEALAGAERFS